ncbi:MAG TPA: sulfite exporter TauE/SafE family protein, partial [Steroidobacteraceae bacterium]|nr:sulfite exporter TauE/SafE family protein [Steroidobacteraceae bacterium]
AASRPSQFAPLCAARWQAAKRSALASLRYNPDAAQQTHPCTTSGAITIGTNALLSLLVALAVWFSWRWWYLERPRRALTQVSRHPHLNDLLLGFVTNVLDTLGIGSFAPTTAVFKLQRRPADEDIPGTLNAGHAPPTFVEALIFISAVRVEAVTLVGMIGASVLGAWLGGGIVARLPRRAIQVGMGVALLVSASLFVAQNLQLMPGGGDAVGLQDGPLVFAIVVSFVLGALMMLGIGLYAPCLILVSLLGMNPLTAFPIMMGSCAFLMPVGAVRLIQKGRYDLRAALGLALGGIPGVLIAAYVVKSLPMLWLRWLVVLVVLYAATLMLLSARRQPALQAGRAVP